MPLYDLECSQCGKAIEVIAPMGVPLPECCGEVMNRRITCPKIIKMGYPQWINRIDDIHKAQADKGERLRFVHPSEVRAT